MTGFLRQANRMNLVTSRARDALIVFADVVGMMKKPPKFRNHITAVFSFFQPQEFVKSINPQEDCPYPPMTHTVPDNFPAPTFGDEAPTPMLKEAEPALWNIDDTADKPSSDEPSWGGEDTPLPCDDLYDV